MKKAVIAFFICLLAVVGGTWWFLRGGSRQASLEDTSAGFSADAQGQGRLLKYSEGGTPLRNFQWLRPTRGGTEVAQVLTQTDRQQIAIFKDGQLGDQMHIPRPEGVSEAFHRSAQLRDAAVIPGDVVILLYRVKDPTAVDVPLILAMDLKTQSVRWSHRAVVDHLVLSLDAKQPEGSAVIGYGDEASLVHIPLALQKGERAGAKAPRPAAQTIELPAEIQGITGLLPTGPSTFLVSHHNGLSAFLGAKGWSHFASFPPGPLGFPEPRSGLAYDGRRFWWQPEPGRLVQLKLDGTPVAQWDSKSLAVASPREKDAQLLQLLGADLEGKLWFALAAPSLTPAPLPIPATDPPLPALTASMATAATTTRTADSSRKPEAPSARPMPQTTPPPEGLDRSAWESYLSQGLDFLYCWNPETGALARASWTDSWRKLGPPSDFSMPLSDGELRPAAGGFLFGLGTQAWWLPLKELPLKAIGTSGKASPPPVMTPLVVKAPPSPMMDFSHLPGSPKN